jgi:hypothetical protein
MFPQTLLWDPSLLNLDANWGQAGQRNLFNLQAVQEAISLATVFFFCSIHVFQDGCSSHLAEQTILVLVEIQSLENALRKSEGYFGDLW